MATPAATQKFEVHGAVARVEHGILRTTPKGFGAVIQPARDVTGRASDWVHLPITCQTIREDSAKKIVPTAFEIRYARGSKARVDFVNVYLADKLLYDHHSTLPGGDSHSSWAFPIPPEYRNEVVNGMGLTLAVTIDGPSGDDGSGRWVTISSAGIAFTEVRRESFEDDKETLSRL